MCRSDADERRRKFLIVATSVAGGAAAAGRVLKGSPAPTNLVVPPYRFAGADTLVIGESPKTG